MALDLKKRLEECNGFADIFELVKEAVQAVLKKSRAGLMLGLADLGGSSGFYLGAYYPVASNIIVLNTYPLARILKTRKEIYKPYVFMVLLHEYLHSLDFLDEETVRKLTYSICVKLLGKKHAASELAKDISRFMPQLSFPGAGRFPEKPPEISIVSGFDKGHLTYVS